jgi:hypothetical protein
MSCQKYEYTINELAREQMIESTLRTETLDHCAECEACAQKLKEQRSLTQALRLFAGEPQDVVIAETVPVALLAALHSGPSSAIHNRRWQYWLVAAAAALLIVFGVAAMRLRAPGRNNQQLAVQDPAKPPSPEAASSPKEQAPEDKKPKLRPAPQKKRNPPVRPTDREAIASAKRPAAASQTSDYENEIATEFLPLGYDAAMNLQDGGQIVRVEVPRSTLASFGLPVSMNRATEKVKADLLVGLDGSARAIRFIQ